MAPAEASTKKVVDVKRFASPVKKAQKTPNGSSRSESAPSTRSALSPEKKRAVDLSKVPESRQQEATNGANPSPSRIRQSCRERTTLEAALDRVQAKRETATEESSITTEDEEQSTTSSSVMSDESSVMNALSEAKARYDRMLAEKKRRKARQIKKLRSKTSKKSSASTTPASSPRPPALRRTSSPSIPSSASRASLPVPPPSLLLPPSPARSRPRRARPRRARTTPSFERKLALPTTSSPSRSSRPVPV